MIDPWRRPAVRFAQRACVFVALLGAGCNESASIPKAPTAIFGELGLGPGKFKYPRSITADETNLFVVDKTGRVQRFSEDGAFQGEWMMPNIEHGMPVGLKVHPDGRVFVADTHCSRVMIFSRDGEALGSFGSEGLELGQFQLPTDLAFDKSGNIYVGEYRANDRITKWSSDLRPVAVIGEAPIEGSRLSRPAGLCFDDEDTLWVADACNHRIQVFDKNLTYIREITQPDWNPWDIAISRKGSNGVAFIADHTSETIQKISLKGSLF